MTTGMVQDRNIEKQIGKQMGCMAGFLHIFDRHQILAGKRLYSAKRLPPSVSSSTSSPGSAVHSPEISKELEKPQYPTKSTPSPDRVKHFVPVPELRSPTPENKPNPKPLPIFEFKEGTRSSWKFSREAPRLSLDSRAIVDGKGSIYPREIRTNCSILSETSTDENDEQRRSPSVIARLMGLEPLPNSESEPAKKPELRRSVSESRVSKEFYQNRFIDGNNFRLKQSQHLNSQDSKKNAAIEDKVVIDRKDFSVRVSRGLGPRKSFFDSAEVFPEPKMQSSSIYGEIEKRLRMRGIDEPSKDLETLKQILEALQLKGLLHHHHSKKPLNKNQRNFVYDRSNESPIVLMKVAKSPSSAISPPSSYRLRQIGRRNVNVTAEAVPRRNQNRGRSLNSPTRIDSNDARSPNRRNLFVETQRRNSPVKMNSSKIGSETQMTNRSPRNRKPTGVIQSPKEGKIYVSQVEDESSTLSESSISNSSSQTDTERPNKVEEYKEGRSLLERCDKLLHSIAEITELQPSPVSVLDSSFYKDESSPSPVLKRHLHFKDQVVDVEEDAWVQAISSFQSSMADRSDDCDFVYVMDILRATDCSQEDSAVFLLLEEQQYLKGKDNSKVSRLQRQLTFDTINEILDRNRQLPPWNSNAQLESMAGTSVQEIWFEFHRMRNREEASEDLFEVICNVLRKDLTRDAPTGWRDWPVETSQAVLDIERLIFKDLIGETIRDLATFPGKLNPNNAYMPRRKLVF